MGNRDDEWMFIVTLVLQFGQLHHKGILVLALVLDHLMGV